MNTLFLKKTPKRYPNPLGASLDHFRVTLFHLLLRMDKGLLFQQFFFAKTTK
ncbi:MAG: hypothetical protein H6Q43_2663 [Deltaproteobacteria bacterium]|nr:hypothetical protein [Deltaproteobacteria bacterium]